MSEMRFEDQQNEFSRPPATSSGFDLSGMLIKWGLASSRQQAEYVLMTVGVLSLLIAGYFFFFNGGSDVQVGPVYANPDAPVILVQ